MEFTSPASLETTGDAPFWNCHNLIVATFDSGIPKIHNGMFYGCSSLTDIFFKGTKAQFNDILKDRTWMVGTPLQTVHCSDGDLNYVE